jgi:hypothetical protein
MGRDFVDVDSDFGLWLGIALSGLIFVIAWFYCFVDYGFLLGFGIGWLPSGIMGAMVFGIARFFWKPIGLVILLAFLLVVAMNRH